MEKELEDKITMACEVVEKRLEVIWSAIDSVDTKINVGFGFASGILGLLAGFYSLADKPWPYISLILFGLATVSYIVLVVLCILGYKIKAWSYRPDVETLLEHCENKEYTLLQMKKWLADECNESFYNNIDSLNTKANLANFAFIALVIETILLTSGLAYAIFYS
jgi:hypothetical protein